MTSSDAWALDPNRDWYRIEAKSNQPNSTEIFIYEAIGDWDGISAQRFVSALQSIKTRHILLRINSPGGSVIDGIAIYNALRYHPAQITVRIEGVAASIASVIAMAGNKVIMAENSWIMIHNPMTDARGDAHTMRRVAEQLDKIREGVLSAYLSRTNIDSTRLKDLMDAETWMLAHEALEQGFIDEIDAPIKMAACQSFQGMLTNYRHTPDLTNLFSNNLNPTKDHSMDKPDVENTPSPQQATDTPPLETPRPNAIAGEPTVVARLCREGGYPELTAQFIEDRFSIDQVKARLVDCQKIKALCVESGFEEDTNTFISAGMASTEVSEELFHRMAKRQTTIDNSLSPGHESPSHSVTLDSQSYMNYRNGVEPYPLG